MFIHTIKIFATYKSSNFVQCSWRQSVPSTNKSSDRFLMLSEMIVETVESECLHCDHNYPLFVLRMTSDRSWAGWSQCQCCGNEYLLRILWWHGKDQYGCSNFHRCDDEEWCDQQRVVQTLLNTDAETLAGTSDLGSTAPLITAQVLSVTAWIPTLQYHLCCHYHVMLSTVMVLLMLLMLLMVLKVCWR